MNNLGGAYYALQRYKQAELLGLQVLTEFNKIYRKDHLSVGIASKNLAMAYHAQGTLGLAEILYERAISILKPRFGAAHSQVSTLMKNHANVLDQMGSSYECEQIRTELKNAVVCQLFDANSPERISA
jgi:tetratricopeptide (TPR) repeat protein